MISKVTKVVIIEDNEVVKDGFALLINSMEGYDVSGKFADCESAIKSIQQSQPEVILMDIDLPGMNGIEGTRKIKKMYPEIDIIVITVHEDSELVFEALCSGASGYITKNSDYSRLLDAINEVRSGGAPMSSNIARMVVESFQKNTNSPLTARETEVLELLSKGKSYTVIADELFIHKETVKSHIKNIYFKLQVNSKAEAIEKALKDKLI
ncbi:response regulator transcription factor [Chondrinema litorale]|uniref:response regulator transcription factor n=1 Tax=Chondrinema litorale TaxID=2994555 RepID=UPI002542B2A1|nr:response regulator transcription factor [Chondrinema litorale]UZR93381.1 response regulator transcription factor [Chondrinema litorale]